MRKATQTKDFSQPQDVTDLDIAFAGTDSIRRLMPLYDEIPKEFKSWNNLFVRLQSEWFFEGLKCWPLKPKPGIDQRKALRHLNAIQRSFLPAHEHKEAAVAYLMSLWFEPPETAA